MNTIQYTIIFPFKNEFNKYTHIKNLIRKGRKRCCMDTYVNEYTKKNDNNQHTKEI